MSRMAEKTKAIFLDRDGVLNVERSYIRRPEELELYPFTAEAVRMINESPYLAVVISNQSALARNLCTVEEVEAVHAYLQASLQAQHAWLDAIYYCPHLYDPGNPLLKQEYNIACDCRKPKTGLFLTAAADHRINLRKSFMVGDSERDILAGRNAGCKTIGVRTGYGLRNAGVLPDHMFSDLLEAVRFILG